MNETLSHRDQLELVTLGESMALLHAADSRGLEYASTVQKSFGGAESNVAIGLSRLGHRSAWMSLLGDDPYGHYVAKAIRGEGVDISRVNHIAGSPTGIMLRESVGGRSSVYYYRKHSAASTMRPDMLDTSFIQSARMLHVTGITCALNDNCATTVEAAVRIAKDAGRKVSFDPNLRLKLWSIEEARARLLPLAHECDYFLPGLDELKLLYNSDDERHIFKQLALIPAVCIVKGGIEQGRGVNYVVRGSQVDEVPYQPVEHVLDTVGAGDAFCAGVLSGLLRGYEPVEAVQLGNVSGAMVVQAVGDWEALPTWKQVQASLANSIHIER
ncbi:sugar kinase [Paenibacillus assamensis]|uniref:sugar kinase n=1 Tax=Paenibacillus assamensis TaxID=311244 RepID=UPI000421E108|nr:sugar kinase [Paenibacillus assamensis]